MAAPATRSDGSHLFEPYGDTDHACDGGAIFDLKPGLRIGGPIASKRRTHLAKACRIGVIGLGGWAAVAHQETVLDWSTFFTAQITSLLERKASGPVDADPPLASLQPLDVSSPITAPELPATTPTTEAADAPLAGVPEEESAAPPVERLPPPIVDPADPYQARALAVGLHPGLSRALLAKLSPVDLQNAGIAISTALAETPDAQVFTWPLRRSPDRAQFQVKFATNAATDCRRYVVHIGMDGWMTTALPMEKCGIPKPRRGAVGARKKN